MCGCLLDNTKRCFMGLLLTVILTQIIQPHTMCAYEQNVKGSRSPLQYYNMYELSRGARCAECGGKLHYCTPTMDGKNDIHNCTSCGLIVKVPIGGFEK